MEKERKEVRHIMISYIPYGDLEYQVKDYENIINFIANYFKEKDYQYVIAREQIINEKLKEDVIPTSVIQKKIEELKNSREFYQNFPEDYMAEISINVLQEILEEGRK